MSFDMKYSLTEDEKKRYTNALAEELAVLRVKADIAQEDLAKLIGVSRQTYGAIERRTRSMTWNTYLSLILFFDYNRVTRPLLRSSAAFPRVMLDRFNDGAAADILTQTGSQDPAFSDILERLDEQALRAINTVIMLEYARCTQLPGEAVVRSFDGRRFDTKSLTRDAMVQKALQQLEQDGL